MSNILVYILEIILMKLENSQTYCSFSEVTNLKKAIFFKGTYWDIWMIFLVYTKWLYLFILQQQLKSLDQSYFFDISTIFSVAFHLNLSIFKRQGFSSVVMPENSLELAVASKFYWNFLRSKSLSCLEIGVAMVRVIK